MKRLLLLALPMFLSSQVPAAFAGKIPEYCGTSGLTDTQQDTCEAFLDKAGVDSISELNLPKIKYPITIPLLNLHLSGLEKPIEVDISSADGTKLRVQYRKKVPYILIPRDRFVSWDLGNESSVDAGGAIGATLGALFFPPMLLAAPFMIGNVKTNFYTIKYLSEDGSPSTLALSATGQHHKTMAILNGVSGLAPSEKQDPDLLRAAQENILIMLGNQRSELVDSLLTTNPKKPWCEFIDLSSNSKSAKAYVRLTKKIGAVSTSLGVAVPIDSRIASTDELWHKYLSERPGLKIWTENFPAQAEEMKQCPIS